MVLIREFLSDQEKQNGARGRSGGRTRGSQREPQLKAPPTFAWVGITKKECADAGRSGLIISVDRREARRPDAFADLIALFNFPSLLHCAKSAPLTFSQNRLLIVEFAHGEASRNDDTKKS